MSVSNAITPGPEGLLLTIELMGKATEQRPAKPLMTGSCPIWRTAFPGRGRRGTDTTRGRSLPRPGRSTSACRGTGSAYSRRRYRRRVGGLDAQIGAIYAQEMPSSGISRSLSAKSGVEVSEKLVLAIVKGSYGEGLITSHFSIVSERPIPLAELLEKGIIQEPNGPRVLDEVKDEKAVWELIERGNR